MPAKFKRKQSGSDTVNNKSYVTKNSYMFKLFFNRTIWLGRRHKDALYIDSALQYMDLSLQELLSSLYHTENKSYKKKDRRSLVAQQVRDPMLSLQKLRWLV